MSQIKDFFINTLYSNSMIKTNLVRNFLIQRILLGNLTIQESMKDSIEFIQSSMRDDLSEIEINEYIQKIDYRLEDTNGKE